MEILNDYSHIRGVCHNPRLGDDFSQEELEKELGYCQRLQLNSLRFWMLMDEWEKDGDAYFDALDNFMRTAWKYGVSSMPILWNGNFIREFEDPSDDWYAKAEAYAKQFIDRFHDEPFILMWDVINEPFCNDYMNHSPADEYDERFENITRYVRRLFDIVRRCDPDGCITVGHEAVPHCVSSNDLVDVISFHDYLHTRKEVEDAILDVKAMSEQWQKPIINTETGCVGRANPYEVELELLHQYNIGFYVFNLVSQGFWGDIHGLVYPDGTIRDPSVIAALFGFFRNRTEGRILVNANKEGHAYRAVQAVEDVLRVEQTTLFMQKSKTSDDILEAAEYCVNILEGAEMVAMWDAPSAKIQIWRAQPEAERDIHTIRRFAYDMAQLVRENCLF
jgi:hypothetical protein